MADFELKNGQGTIFKNEKKEKETQPDYNGKIKTLNGDEFDLSLWVAEAKSGKKYFKVSVKEPYNRPTQAYNNTTPAEDDDFPF